MAGSKQRIVDLRIDLLDLTGTPIGELPSATTDGSITLAVDQPIHGTGSLTCVNPDVDWLKTRVRPVFIIDGVEQAAGVYVPAVPRGVYAATAVMGVQLMDKLSLLAQDRLDTWLTIPAGRIGTDVIREVIEGAGQDAGAITPSTATLRTALVFAPGTTKLQIVDLVRESIGYTVLWCDWEGQYRTEPFVMPANRPLDAVFDESRESLRTAPFEREQDLFGIPNAVMVMSQATGDNPALIGRATNTNPDSPFSIANRGGRFYPEGDPPTFEAATQAIIDQHAERYLLELSSPTAKLGFEHAFLPGVRLNSAVGWGTSLVPTEDRAIITDMIIPLNPTQLVSTQALEVKRL